LFWFTVFPAALQRVSGLPNANHEQPLDLPAFQPTKLADDEHRQHHSASSIVLE
jgi:hypothetical protein